MTSKGKLLIVSAIFVMINYSFAQNTMPKKYQSLLWEISGNGLKKPSYLYGTMHVSDKLVFNLPDSFFVALKACDAVALELDMDTWMDDIMMMQEAEKNKNTVPYISKPYSFYRNAFALDVPTERDLKSVLQFSPNITNRMMYRNNKQNSDYEEDNYLDVFIFQAGKKLNKKIIGLEYFKKTEELSKKADEDEENNDVDEKIKEELNEQKRLRLKELRGDKAYYDVLEDAYRKGDLDLLDSLSKLSSDEGFLKYMLFERNEIMANRMDSIMRKNPLFTGVGAAHLAGQKGIIELLRKMGYTLRPISTVKSDIKTKTQIDETRFPTQFKTQYSPDSVFSVSVPGKMYEIPDEGSFKYYLHNDMRNGSYYCIQRMNHYGKLLDQTQDYILKRIDSLIFENIPGKLLSKKEIKNANGYPGIEIVNKTAKGDIQRHQIFITPNEIFSFKMSGSQEYVKKGTEADAFFNSIVFYESPKSETEYQSKYGYAVTIPAIKSISDASSARNRMQHEIITATNKQGTYFDLLMSASLYDFDYIEEDTFELNMLAERFCLQTDKKIITKNYFTQNGNPALGFKMETKNKTGQNYFGQIMINGADYYLMCTNKDSAAAKVFFNSFKTTNKKYNTPLKSITDTALFFSATAQEITNDYSSLLDDDNKEKKYKTKKEKDEKEKKQFLPVRQTRVYTSPETKEKVYVEYRKFSMFFQQETMEEFWKSRLNTVSDGRLMKISRVVSTKKDKISEYNFMLSDTGSTRGIMVKIIQRCGTLYTLKAVVDTAKGLNGFAKTFFESFTPKDTCIGVDVTSQKLDTYFFSKLYSTDTNESKRAKGAIEYVQANMLTSNVPTLIKTINNKEFNSLSPTNKKDLIACFESVKSKETVPFLETLYQRYSDSVEIELSILKTLARLKTTEATKMFLKLLKTDVPITANEFSISNIFTIFGDSLQNATLLFPELVKYTKYVEYKNGIYKLMSQAAEAKTLKPKAYSKQVGEILLDANYELKKYISEKDRDKEGYRYSYSLSRAEKVYDDLNTRQQKVYTYTVLLAPFYKNNDVKKFFDKLISSSTSDKFKAVIYGQMIVSGVDVHDSIIKKHAASPTSRMVFYKVLKSQNKLSMFDKEYLNQKDLVISQLYGGNESFKKDTLVVLATNKVEYSGKPGNVYIFKTRPKDKKIWKLGYSAVHPADNTAVNFKPQYTKTSFSFDSETQMQKEIDNLMRKIRVENHKRASVKDFEKESDGGGYNYWDY